MKSDRSQLFLSLPYPLDLINFSASLINRGQILKNNHLNKKYNKFILVLGVPGALPLAKWEGVQGEPGTKNGQKFSKILRSTRRTLYQKRTKTPQLHSNPPLPENTRSSYFSE
ncbi:MAG: hypothetical protein DRR19_03715 [Candidatus Parabeggiatoa sp. nov. 1]|nr:MAG: hypothetical protein DRR19_03715 [Gammaproteobacteria bacterium]